MAVADEQQLAQPAVRGWRFWALLVCLSLSGLLVAIEGTIIVNALPTITAALGGSNLYLWVANAYFLAACATLPLYAQCSNIFGRRWPLLLAVAVFTLGRGLSGGASSMSMLIAARTVQGVGGGGIGLLVNTVVADLVPLRERGKYMPVVLMSGIVGATLGPVVGGAIASRTTWRWMFYLNVPIGGVTLVALFFFLRVKHGSAGQYWWTRAKRIDIGGNLIFIAAVTAVLLALTWGGTVYAWSTYHIIVALVLGFFGLALFTAFEWTPRLAPEPSFPRGAGLESHFGCGPGDDHVSFDSDVLGYFLPIYFQSVKGSSPIQSGVQTSPTFAAIVPFSIAGGVALSKTGRYKSLHIVGWAIVVVSYGLYSLLDANSSTAAWVCFQLLQSVGTGTLASVTLPAIQAPLDESYVGTSTGLWSFFRSFGSIWGVTIPAAVFNNECNRYTRGISDAVVASYLSKGNAYEFATQAYLQSIKDPSVRQEVIVVFSKALRTVWYVGIAFAGVGFLLGFLEKEVALRTQLSTEFGMEESKSFAQQDKVGLESLADDRGE